MKRERLSTSGEGGSVIATFIRSESQLPLGEVAGCYDI